MPLETTSCLMRALIELEEGQHQIVGGLSRTAVKWYIKWIAEAGEIVLISGVLVGGIDPWGLYRWAFRPSHRL